MQINESFWYKRKSFEHEKEVRAILKDFDSKDIGKNISCDLSILLDEVFVSPSAPTWFVNLVYDVNKKYKIKVEVCQSALNDEPFY